MTDYYLASGGSNTSPYDTWAKAATSISTLASTAGSGDRIFVDKDFQETLTGTLSFNGGAGSAPLYVIGVDRTGDPEPPLASDMLSSPPSAYNFTRTSGNWNVQASNLPLYFHGIGIGTGGLRTFTINGELSNGGRIVLDTCYLFADNVMVFGNTDPRSSESYYLRDCAFEMKRNFPMSFGDATSVVIDGGGFNNSHVPAVAAQFITNTANFVSGADVLLRGFGFGTADFTGTSLLDADNGETFRLTLERCDLPSSISELTQATITGWGSALRLHASPLGGSGGSDFNSIQEWTYPGKINTNKTVTMTDGSTDGNASYSMQMTTNAQASRAHPLIASMQGYFTDTGAKTITVHFVHDATSGNELSDEDLWIDVIYGGVASTSEAAFSYNAAAILETTPSDHAASTETWSDTLGDITDQNKQKMTATFTVQSKGPYTITVNLAKASQTVWVDLLPVIT